MLGKAKKCSNIILPDHRNYCSLAKPLNGYKTMFYIRDMGSKKERQSYESLLPHVISDIAEPFAELFDAHKYVHNLLDCNIPKHNHLPGSMVAPFYKSFVFPEETTPYSLRLANTLGWCVDLQLTAYQINDDIFDESETRYNRPAWYKHKDVGMRAVLDAGVVDKGCYILLKKYLYDHPSYISMVDCTRITNTMTAMGQALDTQCVKGGQPQLHLFTAQRYNTITKYKGTYPALIFPVCMALHLAKKFNKNIYDQAKIILLILGKYLAAQNDIQDCFGDPRVTGKVGTDISTGKCNWLVVNALERATDKQRSILEQHYGKPEPQSIEEVKRLYDEMDVIGHFSAYEDETFNEICKKIEVSDPLLQEPLLNFTNTLKVWAQQP